MESELQICSSCGTGIQDTEFATQQVEQLQDGQLPMCRDCIETHSKRVLEPIIKQIREKLKEEHQNKWDNLTYEDKFIRFLKYRQEGIIKPTYAKGYPESMTVAHPSDDIIRLKAFQLRYDNKLSRKE